MFRVWGLGLRAKGQLTWASESDGPYDRSGQWTAGPTCPAMEAWV